MVHVVGTALVVIGFALVFIGVLYFLIFERLLGMTEIPAWLLARSRDRRAELNEQNKQDQEPPVDPVDPVNALALRLQQDKVEPVQDEVAWINSGRMVKIVHQCDPPHVSQIPSRWGAGTQWQCDCGVLFVMDHKRTWSVKL